MVAAATAAAEQLGASHARLVSRAYHDALFMAQVRWGRNEGGAVEVCRVGACEVALPHRAAPSMVLSRQARAGLQQRQVCMRVYLHAIARWLGAQRHAGSLAAPGPTHTAPSVTATVPQNILIRRSRPPA